MGNLGILAGQRTLVANLGKIVHEHVRMADSFILVSERPLVVNFGWRGTGASLGWTHVK